MHTLDLSRMLSEPGVVRAGAPPYESERQLWNASAEAYYRIAPSVPCYPHGAGMLAEALKDISIETAVDLGCGSTLLASRYLLRQRPDIRQLIAVDESPLMLRWAKSAPFDSRIELTVADAGTDGWWPENGADAIVCNASAWQIGLERLFSVCMGKNVVLAFNLYEWDLEMKHSRREILYEAIDQELSRRGLPPKLHRGSPRKYEADQVARLAADFGGQTIVRRHCHASMGPLDYRLLYNIPAIAEKSLRHLNRDDALEVLSAATLSLTGCKLEPLAGELFVFEFGSPRAQKR
jgi:SAM-dependent methyltransferase